MHGSTSLYAYMFGIYGTFGEYHMVASFWRLVIASLIEAAYLVLTFGMGALLSLGFRIFTADRQSVSEKLLGLVPMREVVRPMHFTQLPTARNIITHDQEH